MSSDKKTYAVTRWYPVAVTSIVSVDDKSKIDDVLSYEDIDFSKIHDSDEHTFEEIVEIADNGVALGGVYRPTGGGGSITIVSMAPLYDEGVITDHHIVYEDASGVRADIEQDDLLNNYFLCGFSEDNSVKGPAKDFGVGG